MPAIDSTPLPVLVVGATGSLGGKVVDELLARGKKTPRPGAAHQQGKSARNQGRRDRPR